MQKVIVSKNDFEDYSFSLPLKNSLGNKKNKFIVEELEKRHPCFSDDYSYDCKLKIGKSGFMAEVIVIQKRKLTAYRKKAGGWRGLCFEGYKRKSFSCFHLSRYLIIFILISLCVAVFCRTKKAEKIEKDEVFQNAAEVEQEQSYIQETVANHQKLKEVLGLIKNGKGKVESFSWKENGSKAQCAMFISSLFPEQMQKEDVSASFSVVNYEKGIPSFSYSFIESLSRSSFSENSDEKKQKCPSIEEYKGRIRSYFLDNNCEIRSESTSPYELSIETKSSLVFFDELKKLLSELGISIKEISIKIDKENLELNKRLSLTMEKDVNTYAGFDLELLMENLDIFNSEIKKSDEKKSLTEKNREELPGKKLGEVIHANGMKVIFYKTPQGKLVRREERCL